MSLVAVTAGKGAPGVTTTALALTAVWPRPAVLAECDPAGSDLALRLRADDGGWLPRDRGLLGLVSTLSVGGAVDTQALVHSTQPGVRVLLGPPTSVQAAGIRTAWAGIAEHLAGMPGVDVIADCGRLTPDSPVLPVVRQAELVLVVTRPTADAVVHARAALRVLAQELSDGDGGAPDVAVVVTGTDDQAAQVGEALRAAGLPDRVLGAVPCDPRAVAALGGPPTRGLDRSPLLRSVRALAGLADRRLADRTRPPVPAAAPRPGLARLPEVAR